MKVETNFKISFKNLGLIEYNNFLKIQEKLTFLEQNIVLFAVHYPVFTVGKNEFLNFPWAVKVNRGGSITYFDEGTLMVYFIFNISNPLIFFRKIRKILDIYSQTFNLNIFYDKKNAGYYIENRKLISIGFSYKNNRSNHGISININPNLKTFNKINPCNLRNIKATSLYNENIKTTLNVEIEKLKRIIKDIYETQDTSTNY